MDKIVALCKRRGFVFPASEIYGGIANTYDYGHYGVLLKNNVIGQWWKAMIQERDDIVALDSAIIQHPRTWEASGHLEGFTDPLVDCRTCHCASGPTTSRRRAGAAEHPESAAAGALEAAGRPSGLRSHRPARVQPHVRDDDRPVKEAGATAFLRPETAQGIFLGFKTTLQYARRKPPFGIAQVGKSFRNEITPGNFIFRTLEFEQMEMEFFVPPDEAERWFEYWLEERRNWYERLGLDPERLRLRAHGAEELSHYSRATSDIEYLYPIGWLELEGIANRGDFDLTQHAKHSGEKLEYVDTATQERYVPHVIEPAGGVGRTLLALLCDAYHEEEVEGRQRTVLRLHPQIAPVKVAVLPLVNRDGMPELAREIYEELRARIPAEYDAGGSIGRRYRRQDEIGTPWGITVDGQTIEDRTVTLRDRDTLEQVRVPIDELATTLAASWPHARAGLRQLGADRGLGAPKATRAPR